MATVESVTGPIDVGDLGTTLVHEHLRCWDDAVHFQWPTAETAREDAPHGVGPGEDFDEAVKAARSALELGVKSIVDPTAMFLGRDVAFMRRVAEETGLQVIPCTGIYTYDYLPLFLMSRSAEQIADLYVQDIEQGSQGTDIKAAFIKCAADEPGVNENIEKLHRAAAKASLRTGAPIMAHSRPASDTAPRQIEIFLEEGVEPSKIQIAHCGDTADLDQLERILETGVWIGLDRYGLDMYLPYDQRQQTTLALLERGYADRVFLSADSCATIDWFPSEQIGAMMDAGMANDWTIRIVPEKVLPELREAGLTEEQERTIMVDNPARWLTA